MNMGYIRFENTLKDLEDCEQYLDESGISELSDSEHKRAIELIELCQEIWDKYSNLLNYQC